MTLIEVVSKLSTQRGTTENKRDLCVCILSIHRVKKVNNVILAFRTASPRNDKNRNLLLRLSLLTGVEANYSPVRRESLGTGL